MLYACLHHLRQFAHQTRAYRLKAAILCLVIAAWAALAIMPKLGLASPSDLPDPEQSASLTIHKYLLPDEVEPGIKADGSARSAVTVPEGAQPLQGITFSIRHVYSQGEVDAILSQDSVQADNFGHVESADEELASYYVYAGEDELEQSTDANGVAQFKLTGHQGTYLVTEMADARIEVPADPFLVSVPMVDPGDASKWLYHVHVYPKNYQLDIDKWIVVDGKDVMAASNATGEANTFHIAADIPSNVGSYYKYAIWDTLDWRLTVTEPTPEECVVKVGDVVLEAGNDYSVSVIKDDDAQGHEIQIVQWEFMDEGLSHLQELVLQSTAPGTVRVDVTFVARLNDNAVSGTLDNGAQLLLTDHHEKGHTMDSERPTLSYAAIRVTKTTNTDQEQRLAGATFCIAASEADAYNQNWMHKLAADGSDTGVWKITTGDDGLALFGGLEFDLTGGSDYWLAEVQAPAGYQALTEPVRVHVGSSGAGEVTLESTSTALTSEVKVINTPVPLLPATGGTSSALPLVGAIVIACGSVLAITAGVRMSRRGR